MVSDASQYESPQHEYYWSKEKLLYGSARTRPTERSRYTHTPHSRDVDARSTRTQRVSEYRDSQPLTDCNSPITVLK